MKKLVSLLLALTMVATALVGCGAKEEAAAPAATESADAKFVIGGIGPMNELKVES